MNANRTLTAFFDNRTDAEAAVARLVQIGISRSEIDLVEGQSQTATGSATSDANESPGFWASLERMFMPDEDRNTYAEGLRRGGYLVSVRSSDAQYEKALDILDDEGTINIDERANSWRSEGWTGATPGYATGAARMGTTGTAGAGSTRGQPSALGTAAATGSRTGTTARDSATGMNREDEVIPVAEERLNIGKREEIAGRVRVRSYVVETPVHEQVNLRQEHVNVERRPVDRAASGTEGAFRDRTIDAVEKSERAVVNKEARITEEVVVRKSAENRTETVNDKLRKTQVEVEDDRQNRGTGTSGVGGTTGTPRRT
ncbi:MAG: hypothetical protein JWM36_1532 [Hyphomicrobiales bacterium]|nr:hypothetical protein [Hyphomicrobiales bacterium]